MPAHGAAQPVAVPWRAATAIIGVTLLAVMARHPLTDWLGTGAPQPRLTIPPASLVVVPSGQPHPSPPRRPAPRHPPRDPFRSYVTPTTAVPPTPTARVVVRTGQSLWSIATEELGAAATAAEVAGYLDRLEAANRAQLGGDPNLVRPGQNLALPVD